jgi:hypothetical protein
MAIGKQLNTTINETSRGYKFLTLAAVVIAIISLLFGSWGAFTGINAEKIAKVCASH